MNTTSLPFRKGLGLGRLILCLSLATFGVNDVWGGTAKVYAHATPSKGGFVYVSTSNSAPSSYSLTDDEATGSGIAGDKDFYLFYQSKSGYEFQGWATSNTATTGDKTQGKHVKQSATGFGEKSSTYYAIFKANSYTISFNGNGATSGSMSNMSCTYDQEYILTSNNFARSHSVTYLANGGTISKSSDIAVATFNNWSDGNGNNYANSAKVSNLTTTNNATVTLSANWTLGTVTLPTATNGGIIEGWYDGDTKVGEAGGQYTPEKNVTLTAHWGKLTPSINGTNKTMWVDEKQSNAFSFTNAPDAEAHINVISISNISDGSGDVISYDKTTNTITAINAGVAEIYFTQIGTDNIKEGTSDTYIYTINKYDNHISINGSQDSYATSIYMDAQQSISLTATNTDYSSSPITAAQTAGSTIAVMNNEQTQVTSNYNLGTATWTISQPENYKYKAANATFTVHVVKQAEETCNVATSSSTYWAKLGNTTDALTWIDQNAAKDLYFKATISTASVSNAIQVQQYVNGAWSDIGSKIDGMDNYPDGSKPVVTLSQAATGVRWKISGSLGSDITNVRVTRKTYLNASDVNITKTQSNNPIYPGESGVGTLTINHSLANGGDLKVKWDNAKFTIGGKTAAEGINLGDKGCSTGVTELAIEYVSQEAGEHKTTVVIYNNVYRATATITGTTNKKQQTITWKENIDILTAGTDVENPASSTVGNVTYTTSDETVISVEGNIIHALKAGTATITAFSAGDAYYADAQAEKEITVTDDKVQYIVWNQSFTNLKIGDADKTLDASAQSDVEKCSTNGARLITYFSSNENVVKIINTNQLHIIGVGTTTITATQAGGEDIDGHTYIATSMQKKVVVRDPSAECVNYIYIQEGEWKKDLGWNLATTSTETYEIDFNGQEPGYYNVDYKGESHDYGWPYAVPYYNGELYIDQLVDNNWVTVQKLGEPAEDQNLNTGNISLNRKATKMRFNVTGKAGYFYFKDCTVTLARYLEATNTLNKFETRVGAEHKQTLSIQYSNIEGPLTFKLTSGTSFSINTEEIDGECGSKGKATIEITYHPTSANDEETDILTITDGKNSTLEVHLTGSASKTQRHINWDQEPTHIYTIETVTLNAEARTDLNEVAGDVYYTIAQNSTAAGKITDNVLSFTKDGSATIVVNTISNDKYTDAIAISKTWTVSKTPTKISKLPTIGNIVSRTNKEAIVLTDWQVINTVNSEPVEGNLSITAGDLTNAGTNTITLTFTPNNTDMYESCTADMQVEVFYYTFTGTDGNWANANNWLYNTMPENGTNDVVITGQLTITEDKTFTTLTLNGESSSVSIANDVKVIIQNGSLTEIGTTTITNYGQMNILSNATLAIHGGTFHANRLSFTGGLYTSNETKTYGVPHLYIAPEASMALTKEDVDYFLNIDAANYYPFAVPFEVPVSSIHYANTEYTYAQCYDWNAAEIDYYDGADRANKNTSSLTNSQYWKPIKTDGNLQPGVGYIISALPLSETEANLQMTMTIPNSAVTNGEISKTVSIAANAGTEKTSWNNKGWNYIANPYMSKFNNNKDDELMLAQEYTGSEGVYEPISPAVRYVTVPSETMSDYTQTPAKSTTIEPFRGFFIQAANSGSLSFENGVRAAVPARMSAYQEEAYPEQQAYLRVSDGCNSDMIGLIIHENYSADYDVNADLVKMLGETNSLRSYLTYEGNKMAFLALNQDLATEAISVGIRIPKNTIYTWSVDSISKTDMLDALYLMDYTTNTMTNLLVSDYSFTADAGTINERFAINAVVNPNRQPTETRHTITKNQDTQKIIFRNHLYIVHKGIVYDGQGTRVTNIQ